LVTALDVRHSLDLDRMLLVPANVPWQKIDEHPVTPIADRVAMLRAAIEGVAHLEVSLVDVDRGGATYSADTLADLAGELPDAELYLVIGADLAAELDTWVRVDDIKQLATLAVVGRPGAKADLDTLRVNGWRCLCVDVPALGVSSSMIRQRVFEGRPIDFLVPPGAIHFIRERHLYARDR
jgi:nicotinate-nucleotide adenylyltransferase